MGGTTYLINPRIPLDWPWIVPDTGPPVPAMWTVTTWRKGTSRRRRRFQPYARLPAPRSPGLMAIAAKGQWMPIAVAHIHSAIG